MLTDTNRVKKLLSTRATKRAADSTTVAAVLALLVGGAMLVLGVVSVEDSGQGRIGAIRSILADMAGGAAAEIRRMSPYKYEALDNHGKLALKEWFLTVDDFGEFELEKSQESALEFGFKELAGEDAGKYAVICQDGERLLFQSEEGQAQKAWPLTEKDGVFEADVHEMCAGADCNVFSATMRGKFLFEGVAEDMHELVEETDSSPEKREQHHAEGNQEPASTSEVQKQAPASTVEQASRGTTTHVDEAAPAHVHAGVDSSALGEQNHGAVTKATETETEPVRVADTEATPDHGKLTLPEPARVGGTGSHMDATDQRQPIDNAVIIRGAVIKVADQYFASYSEGLSYPYTLTSDAHLAAKLDLHKLERGYSVMSGAHPWKLLLQADTMTEPDIESQWPLIEEHTGDGSVFELDEELIQSEYQMPGWSIFDFLVQFTTSADM